MPTLGLNDNGPIAASIISALEKYGIVGARHLIEMFSVDDQDEAKNSITWLLKTGDIRWVGSTDLALPLETNR